MNENKQGKEDKELMRVRNRHEYYRTVQYLLLKSLAGYNTSLKLSFLEKFMDLSLSDVADVVHILGGIFRADFDKILKAGDGIDMKIQKLNTHNFCYLGVLSCYFVSHRPPVSY
ncbi:hypothetical protein TNCT_678511 [Trichonephila clavata]|uniref:Uncharacterized protein n=1 Tax=Trichonephila clavata TaxID=2740835 RepID=A0A8X6H4K6_TRICU|nr:hypothetical protein TNCT_678511 [Trichonephila clavata]